MSRGKDIIPRPGKKRPSPTRNVPGAGGKRFFSPRRNYRAPNKRNTSGQPVKRTEAGIRGSQSRSRKGRSPESGKEPSATESRRAGGFPETVDFRLGAVRSLRDKSCPLESSLSRDDRTPERVLLGRSDFAKSRDGLSRPGNEVLLSPEMPRLRANGTPSAKPPFDASERRWPFNVPIPTAWRRKTS
jgi:hypothetical protein